MQIRTSEEKDFKRCPQKWEWAWVDGLRPLGAERDALWFGSGIHLALGLWYEGPGLKRGPHPAETWETYAKNYYGASKMEPISDEEESAIVDLQQLGRVLMDQYVKLYGIDEHKLYIQAEQTWAVDIPWSKVDKLDLKRRVDNGEVMAQWVGTYDGAFRNADTGLPWLDEHKTAKAITTSHLPLDPQASKYWATATGALRAKGLLGEKEILAGIEYNFIRKALPDTRPQNREGYFCNKPIKKHYQEAFEARGLEVSAKESLETMVAVAFQAGMTVHGDVSKQQPKPLFERHPVVRTRRARASVLTGMQDSAYLMRAAREGLIPITITPTRDCHWDCSFYDMCVLKQELGPTSETVQEYLDLQYERTDPYADHHEMATE